jgi:hypothetical protein
MPARDRSYILMSPVTAGERVIFGSMIDMDMLFQVSLGSIEETSYEESIN